MTGDTSMGVGVTAYTELVGRDCPFKRSRAIAIARPRLGRLPGRRPRMGMVVLVISRGSHGGCKVAHVFRT